MRIELTTAAMIFTVFSASAMATESNREGPRAILPMHQTSKMVEFDHLRHSKTTCVDCHHNIGTDLPQTFTPYKCSSCHSSDADQKSESHSYFEIIHGDATQDDPASRCLTCHQEAEQDRSADQPSLTSCANSSCH